MKTIKLFSLIFLFIGISFGFSQNLNIKDLIETLKCNDYSCYNLYVSSRGFSFKKLVEKSYKEYIYISDANFTYYGDRGEEIIGKETCYGAFSSQGIESSGFLTNRKEEYLSLNNELIEKGFKYINNENYNNVIALTYKSTQYPNLILYVRTYKNEIDNHTNWNTYEFAIMKSN